VTVLQRRVEQFLLTLLRVLRIHHCARNDLVNTLKDLSLFCPLDIRFLYCRRLGDLKGLHACVAGEVSSLEYQDRQEPLLDGKELASPTKTRNGSFALAWNVLLDRHDLALSALESRQLCLQVCKVLLTGWQCGGQL